MFIMVGQWKVSSFNTATRVVDKSEENAQMICCPTPPVPNNRDEGIHNNPFDGVRDWIFEISEWREWSERESRFLPGVGVSRSAGNHLTLLVQGCRASASHYLLV